MGGRGRTQGIHDIADTGKSKTHKGGEEKANWKEKNVGRSKRVKSCNSDVSFINTALLTEMRVVRGSGNPARMIHKEP